MSAQAIRNCCASTLTSKTATPCTRLPSGDCGACFLKVALHPRFGFVHHLYEDALNQMQERVTPEVMGLRRCMVEYPLAKIKYPIFGHPRSLMRGLSGARVEIGIATMAYNIKRITNVLGAVKLTEAAPDVLRYSTTTKTAKG
jgi:hypothetical protein